MIRFSGGAITVASVGSTPSAAGASASGTTLTLQPADATHPGVVTTGTQSIAGAKTFTGNVVVEELSVNDGLITTAVSAVGLEGNSTNAVSACAIKLANTAALTAGTDRDIVQIYRGAGFANQVANITSNGSYNTTTGAIYATGAQFTSPCGADIMQSYTAAPCTIRGQDSNGGTAIGVKLTNVTSLTTAGAKIASFSPDAGVTEKAYVTKDGDLGASGGNYNNGHLILGSYHIWVQAATGKLLIKSSAPTTDADGTVIGTQA